MTRAARPDADAIARWSASYRAGRIDECIALAQALGREFPGSAKAWQLLGISCFASRDGTAARAHLEHAAALAPDDPAIWDNLGIVCRTAGDHAGARAAFDRAIALSPAAAGIWSNAAGNELEGGNAGEALRLAERALSLGPNVAACWLQLGLVLDRLQRNAEAEAAMRRALRLAPRHPEALLSLSVQLAVQGRLEEACEAASAVLQIDPRSVRAHLNLGSLHDRLGEQSVAQQHYRCARELDPTALGAWSSELYCLAHDGRAGAEEVFRAHKAFGDHADRLYASARSPHPNDRDPQRTLRVGVVSADFRDHPVARFLAAVWRELDPAALHLVAYDNNPGNDALAHELRTLVREWHDVSRLGDDALAARIRADAIDILIDHSGHTAKNRLGVFARKPAPVQAIWVGYPGTSGLGSMDYRLVDATVAPVGRLDHLFTERLAYLPAMLVFSRPEHLPGMTPAPLERNGFITYGSFNRMNKLGDEVLALWAEILERVPQSRLLIGAIPNEAAAASLLARLAARGVDSARITTLPRLGLADYLAAHAQVDLLLDAFPWSSSTTAHFGLWMGVPTVTLAGESLAARLGAATMSAAGLVAFVAGSKAEYAAIAAQAAARPEGLSRIRASLRNRLELQNERVPAEVARALESRLRQMWQRWCAGLAPCVLN